MTSTVTCEWDKEREVKMLYVTMWRRRDNRFVRINRFRIISDTVTPTKRSHGMGALEWVGRCQYATGRRQLEIRSDAERK
jgi:folylpolyglutamate synthase/dihydropteroate synthase